MKKLLPFLMTLSLHANAQTGDGPFGFDIGADLSSYRNCDKTQTLGIYECRSPEKPHPDMEAYLVQYFDGIGICWVKGIGKDIRDNGLGLSVKAATDKIKSQVAKVYGKPTDTFDFLSYGSIWDELDDWMMGLARKERFYSYAWSADDGFKKVKRVESIFVTARASSSDTGYVVVEFGGDNEGLCDEAKSAAEESAF